MAPRARAARPAGPAPADARRERLVRASWAQPVVSVIILAGMVTTATLRTNPPAFPDSGLVILTIVSWAPLLVRTRWPMAVLGAAGAAESLHLVVLPFTDAHPTPDAAMGAFQPVPIATMVAAYTVATGRRSDRAWVPGLVAATGLALTAVMTQPLHLIPTDTVMFSLVVLAAGVGTLVSARREYIARQEREWLETTRREVVAERLRIARDLHDVLAHHITLVNAQAGVAEYLLQRDPDAASGALHDIALNSRKALDELRATVGLLRQDDDAGQGATRDPEALLPLPGLDRLDDLLDGFRSAGASVRLTVTGPRRPLPPAADLAVYRIVQEAITNATKHAPGASTSVTLDWLRRRLDLRVANGPAPNLAAGHRGPGTWHGLIGMRERAHSCAGTLSAGPTPDGGFAVEATIPLADDPDSAGAPSSSPSSSPGAAAAPAPEPEAGDAARRAWSDR